MTKHSKIAWLGTTMIIATIAIVGVTRVVMIGVGQHYTATAAFDVHAAERAVTWRVQDAAAFYRMAATAPRGERAQIDQLRAALEYNPADGRVLATLARAWFATSNTSDAERAANLAGRLLPMDANAQLQLADFWVGRGTPEAALPRWDAALRSNQRASEQLYPLLLHAAESPQTEHAFANLIHAAPPWWPEFFDYAAANAARLPTLNRLYAARRRSTQLPTMDETRVYLSRLQEDGFWNESYFVWLSGLDDAGRRRLGQPYNGGFERAPTNYGFDWHLPRSRSVNAEIKRTFGVGESHALRVVFRRGHIEARNLYQPMLLGPSKYRLHGRVRLDGLNGSGGVRWQLTCADQTTRVLANSEAFAGTDQWREFSIEFAVPQRGCAAQYLSLEDVGNHGNTSELNGAAWFDDFIIERV